MPWNRKDYPEDWELIRERILTRAKHRCEKCGVVNHSVVSKSDRSAPSPQEWDMINSKVKHSGYSFPQAIKLFGYTRVVLTIAHIKHDKENHEVKDEDLAAWCQKCHLGHDKSRHIENRKYGRNHRKNQYGLF